MSRNIARKKKMKLKYYGTGAGYGLPEVFCDCRICRHARENGGKNIRTRSMALLDGQLAISIVVNGDVLLSAVNEDVELVATLNSLSVNVSCLISLIGSYKVSAGNFAGDVEGLVLPNHGGTEAVDQIGEIFCVCAGCGVWMR